MYHHSNPVVLQNQNCKLTDHIMNVMTTNMEDDESLEKPSSNGSLPLVFVILTISEPEMFRDEFIEGFFKQEYPKDKLMICVCTPSDHSGTLIHLLD